MGAIRGAASRNWTLRPATSTAVPSLHRGVGLAANDNRARGSWTGQGATHALAIVWRLLLGASSIGIIAGVACLLGLGLQNP